LLQQIVTVLLPCVVWLAIGVAGCSTYKTVSPQRQGTLAELVPSTYGERCVSIPRVYSGIAYDVCILLGQARQKGWHGGLPMLPMDLLADTALLPYTVVKQVQRGNLVLKVAAPNEAAATGDDSLGVD